MQLLASIFLFIISCSLYAQSYSTNKPTWYTIRTENFNSKLELTDKEAYEIITHPIYQELSEEKKKYNMKFLELSTGLYLTQLFQSTGDAVVIGRANIIPCILLDGNLWLQDWLGLNVSWLRGIMVTFGAQRNEDAPNSVLLMPSWLTTRAKLRYNFDKMDGSSFIAFNIGYYVHKFPINSSSDFINKRYAAGIIAGAQRRFALSPLFGFDFNMDFLMLSKLEDSATSDMLSINSQKGIGYKFSIDFYGTIIDKSGLKTLISIGYGQTSHISYLHNNGLADDNRELMEANYFEQAYRDIHITFTARI